MLETIKLNSSGDAVKIAQYLMGFAAMNKATGLFDEAFEAKVKEWQAANQLTADGIIGKKSWAALAASAPTCSTSKKKKSVYTCAIQLLVGGITVDGDYGTKTKKAVAAFQSSSKLGADGICGPKTWNALICGAEAVIPEGDGTKILNKCVKYLQYDSKWKNVKYSTHTSKQTIGNSGCGTTSMAMIIATWIDSKITPVEMSKLSVDNGYRTYNSGTSWDFYKFVFKKYDGFEKFVQTSSIATLVAALREGALAVCSMNNKDNCFFTTAGHFVVARGVDDKYLYYNDPNKSETPRKHLIEKSKLCLKQAFIFWPKTTVNPNPDTSTQTPAPSVNLNGKIVDISKHQGTINFNAMAADVSLVIARAGCGSDPDIKFDSYAAEMNRLHIPFGVYCYSYAGDEAKAKDEATKLYQRASKYNPLFYVMDAEEAKINTASIKAFAAQLRACGAKKIGCYCANHRYSQYKYNTIQDLFDFTWIPCYGKNDGTLEGSRRPKHYCDLWQYTSCGKVAGIKGRMDMNVITGDGHDLKWFLET